MHSVEVQILGQSYSVKTDQDAEHIKKIAQYVDSKLREIYSTAPNINQTKASIMVALGIADELFKLRIKQESLDKMIEEKTKMLSSLLE